MIPELGHYALMLALGLALIQGTMPIVGTRTNDAALMSIATPAALAQFAFVAVAFAALAECYVASDFSVLNVFENSNTAKPMLYKVTGVWGSHEGSMMLWVLMLTLFGGLVAALGRSLPMTLRARALAIQGLASHSPMPVTPPQTPGGPPGGGLPRRERSRPSPGRLRRPDAEGRSRRDRAWR